MNNAICKTCGSSPDNHVPSILDRDGIGDPSHAIRNSPLYVQALSIVTDTQKATASLLQRRLRIDHQTAVALLDELERSGVIGKQDGERPREVFKNKEVR